jgi:hypothetical protein
MNNLGYLLAPYTLLWLVVFAHVYSLACRNRALEEQMRALHQAPDRGGSAR